MAYDMQAQTDAYDVGGRIRDVRRLRKMSQEQLAERVGCSMNTVSRIEVGQSNMGLSSFLKYAEALDVTPNDLAPRRFHKQQENDENGASNEIDELISAFLKSSDEDRQYLLKTARLLNRAQALVG